LAGIEFGEPHLYAEELANLKKLPYDFIMGSVHYTNRYPKWFFSRLVKNGISAEDCFEAYWDSILECVSVGGFDCLGHIDIPKRYYKALFYSENKLRLIVRRMLDNGIILEINTSSLAKGVDEPMPGRELLELYKSEGGRYITIGSDAHAAWQLIDSHRAFHAMAQSLANSVGLTEVTYKNRKIREAAQ
jgi:histidinol-phosphatase (PHP family)